MFQFKACSPDLLIQSNSNWAGHSKTFHTSARRPDVRNDQEKVWRKGSKMFLASTRSWRVAALLQRWRSNLPRIPGTNWRWRSHNPGGNWPRDCTPGTPTANMESFKTVVQANLAKVTVVWLGHCIHWNRCRVYFSWCYVCHSQSLPVSYQH